MTAVAERIPSVSAAEYLRSERLAVSKHEFENGQIIAMAGASMNHIRVASNFMGSLWGALKGKPCQPYNSDLRIAPISGRNYYYPEISIVCGAVEYDQVDNGLDTVTNPKAIVEVLSPSSERFDRDKKFTSYRAAASFREYILVAQDAPVIETYYLQEDGVWAFNHFRGLESFVYLRSVDIKIPLADIYAGVKFPVMSET